MDWRINSYSFDLLSDVSSVQGVLDGMASAIGLSKDDLDYTFLHSVPEMLKVSRKIERDIARQFGATLYVGFQNAEKLAREIQRYRELMESGVKVIAFGSDSAEGETKAASQEWVKLPEDHYLLENQWFLVCSKPEPIAFVGWETSDASLWGKRSLRYRDKSFAGFVSSQPSVVDQIIAHLESLRDG